MRIDIFLHHGETAELTEISKKLDELILLHKGEEQLKAAADKLHVSTKALAHALRGRKPK